MSSKERIQIIIIIAAFALAGTVINQAFVLLTPTPDSPEMAHAKAEAFLMQTEANLQNQYLYRTFLVGVVVVLAGIAVVFGSLLVALQILKTVLRLNQPSGQAQTQLPLLAQRRNDICVTETSSS